MTGDEDHGSRFLYLVMISYNVMEETPGLHITTRNMDSLIVSRTRFKVKFELIASYRSLELAACRASLHG